MTYFLWRISLYNFIISASAACLIVTTPTSRLNHFQQSSDSEFDARLIVCSNLVSVVFLEELTDCLATSTNSISFPLVERAAGICLEQVG